MNNVKHLHINDIKNSAAEISAAVFLLCDYIIVCVLCAYARNKPKPFQQSFGALYARLMGILLDIRFWTLDEGAPYGTDIK